MLMWDTTINVFPLSPPPPSFFFLSLWTYEESFSFKKCIIVKAKLFSNYNLNEQLSCICTRNDCICLCTCMCFVVCKKCKKINKKKAHLGGGGIGGRSDSYIAYCTGHGHVKWGGLWTFWSACMGPMNLTRRLWGSSPNKWELSACHPSKNYSWHPSTRQPALFPLGLTRKFIIMVEPCKKMVVPGEWLVSRTLIRVHKVKFLVQLINQGTTRVSLSHRGLLCSSTSSNVPIGRVTITVAAGTTGHYLSGLSPIAPATWKASTVFCFQLGYTKAISHSIHMRNAPFIQEQYCHIYQRCVRRSRITFYRVWCLMRVVVCGLPQWFQCERKTKSVVL